MVRDGDTFDLLRAEFKLKKNKIIEYNDLPDNYTLKANDIIYLKKKKSKAAKNTIIHSVSTNESLHDISQKYAIRLDKLIKMNKKRLEEGLKVGDKIRLR